MLGLFRRRDPDAPSGRIGADGTPLPNWVVAHGLQTLYLRSPIRRLIARHFNRAYYYGMEDTLFGRSWLGHTTLKYPTDLWVYQEILAEVRPDVVLETGTFKGGSALYLATVLDALGHGQVVSVDLAPQEPLPEHPRITYLTGSSTALEVVEQVRSLSAGAERVVVILDSDHSRDHVLDELSAYSDLVNPGSYVIVEDTNVNGKPVLPGFGPGPAEAIEDFLAGRGDFEVDSSREQMLLTANPGGFLRRVRA